MPHFIIIAQNDLYIYMFLVALACVTTYMLGVEAGRRKESKKQQDTPTASV